MAATGVGVIVVATAPPLTVVDPVQGAADPLAARFCDGGTTICLGGTATTLALRVDDTTGTAGVGTGTGSTASGTTTGAGGGADMDMGMGVTVGREAGGFGWTDVASTPVSSGSVSSRGVVDVAGVAAGVGVGIGVDTVVGSTSSTTTASTMSGVASWMDIGAASSKDGNAESSADTTITAGDASSESATGAALSTKIGRDSTTPDADTGEGDPNGFSWSDCTHPIEGDLGLWGLFFVFGPCVDFDVPSVSSPCTRRQQVTRQLIYS
jgi:hypothetical protein